MKVSELEPPLLDYWVAKTLGYQEVIGALQGRGENEKLYWHTPKNKRIAKRNFMPSIAWNQGGPIIHRTHITWEYLPAGYNGLDIERIAVTMPGLPFQLEPVVPTSGDNYILKGAMRCLVAFKYGEEVPDNGHS